MQRKLKKTERRIELKKSILKDGKQSKKLNKTIWNKEMKDKGI